MPAVFSSKSNVRGFRVMSDQNDGINDALAATAVIALVVVTVAYWLSGMPT